MGRANGRLLCVAVGLAVALVLPASRSLAADAPAVSDLLKLCEKAKQSLDLDELDGLLSGAMDGRRLAEAQKKAAEDELEASFDGLMSAGLAHVEKLEAELKAKRAAFRTMNSEVVEMSQQLGQLSGDAYAAMFSARTAKMAEMEVAERELQDLADRHERLQALFVDAADSSGDMAQRAAQIMSAVADLGASATLDFAGPIGRIAAAKLAFEGAGATEEAANSAVDCVSKKVATVEEAEDAAAKFQRNAAITLGKDMQAKGIALKQKEDEIRAMFDRMFEPGFDDARANAAAAEYMTLLEDYVAIGSQFAEQVERLKSEGVVVEPWMTQLLQNYAAAQQTLAQGGFNPSQ